MEAPTPPTEVEVPATGSGPLRLRFRPILVPSGVSAEAGEHQTDRASRPALPPCALLESRSHYLAHALRFIIYELFQSALKPEPKWTIYRKRQPDVSGLLTQPCDRQPAVVQRVSRIPHGTLDRLDGVDPFSVLDVGLQPIKKNRARPRAAG